MLKRLILVSALLLSTNCVTNVEYFDTGANKGDVNNYNSNPVVGPVVDDTVAVDSQDEEKEPPAPKYEGVSRIDINSEVDYWIVEAVTIDMGTLNTTCDESAITYSNELRDLVRSLSSIERRYFLQMYHLASDLALWNIPSIVSSYRKQHDSPLDYNTVFYRLQELQESFKGYFEDLPIGSAESYYEQNNVVCIYKNL